MFYIQHVLLVMLSGLPQHLVSEAQDTDHTEGAEDPGEAGVQAAETHRA